MMDYIWQLYNKGYYDRDESLEDKSKNERLSEITKQQIELYPINTITILNIANGVELKNIDREKIKMIVGVDSSEENLKICKDEYAHLKDQLKFVKVDTKYNEIENLSHTEMLIANLVIEDIGITSFIHLLKKINPEYVSCLVYNQENGKTGLRYPYGSTYPSINDDVEKIKENDFIHNMKENEYHCLRKVEYIQNNEVLIRFDFHKKIEKVLILETNRLILREMSICDFIDIAKMLQDEEVMYAYEHAFSNEEVFSWINKQMDRYQNDGYGLWAVIEKTSQQFIGQCGITNQQIHDDVVMEVGYLFNKEFWHCGYASEAAKACIDYGFQNLKAEKIYSIIRDTNIASINVAKRNGMKQISTFNKFYYGMDMLHIVFNIERGDFYHE